MTPTAKKLNQIVAEANARIAAKSTMLEPRQQQLPLWPEAVRGVPNCALRSALFAVSSKNEKRQYCERLKIPAPEGLDIIFTGVRLDQGDLTVLEELLHFAREESLGMRFRISASRLLRALGQTDGGNNISLLNRRLSRMKATGIDINLGKIRYEGSLIDEVFRAQNNKEFIITLNPNLARLFEADQYTQISVLIRNELTGKPLAQWLHGYYSSHARPYPITVEKLQLFCGSKAKFDFRKTLRKALAEVSRAHELHGKNFTATFKRNLVLVSRTGSASQQRHIARKIRNCAPC
jgi:hypothetical protein